MVAAFAFVMHQQIVKTSTDAQIETARDDNLGTLCGEIVGAGMVVVWFFAYGRRNRQ
jgi:hypothetical protein